jgi:glutamate/tyrosine decarboxylase-like PLP-dependent enzyme
MLSHIQPLPNRISQGETISTVIEARALEMTLDLLHLPKARFVGRALTTGATASNMLGLGS